MLPYRRVHISQFNSSGPQSLARWLTPEKLLSKFFWHHCSILFNLTDQHIYYEIHDINNLKNEHKLLMFTFLTCKTARMAPILRFLKGEC